MKKIISIINKKIMHLVWVLVFNGIFLLILGILIVWTDFVLELVMGLVTVLIAYVFIYGAYKLWIIKKHLDDIIKF